MAEQDWVLREPLKVLSSVDDPYLQTASGRIGDHTLEVHHAPAPETPVEFKVFLDGQIIFEPGLTGPDVAWYRLCRELGYQAEDHWDLDPALILFHQALPALARAWQEHPLPFDELGVPAGVICLATVRAAWEKGVAGLAERADHPWDPLLAACFRDLPLRAVVFHDDPGHREDYVGTAVDDPLLGVFLHFGRSRQSRVTLSKATLNGTGGLRWSPWEPGGAWQAKGREFKATQGPVDFLAAAGLREPPPPEFALPFQAALEGLGRLLDPVVDAYRKGFPVGIPWHRDPQTRYLNRTVVAVRAGAGATTLVLDDGTEVEVVEAHGGELTGLAGE